MKMADVCDSIAFGYFSREIPDFLVDTIDWRLVWDLFGSVSMDMSTADILNRTLRVDVDFNYVFQNIVKHVIVMTTCGNRGVVVAHSASGVYLVSYDLVTAVDTFENMTNTIQTCMANRISAQDVKSLSAHVRVRNLDLWTQLSLDFPNLFYDVPVDVVHYAYVPAAA